MTANNTTSTSSTSTAPAEQSSQLANIRRVNFGEEYQEHMISAEQLDANNWYGADEMKKAFHADVIAFLKEFKRNQQRGEACGDDENEEEEEAEPVCSRGLEMYFPGQIALRKRVRVVFSSNVLRKYQELKRTHGDDIDKIEDHLQQFSAALGQTAQKKAHAVALQDCLEARRVYAEGLRAATTKDPATLEFVSLIKHESKTELTTCKARAA